MKLLKDVTIEETQLIVSVVNMPPNPMVPITPQEAAARSGLYDFIIKGVEVKNDDFVYDKLPPKRDMIFENKYWTLLISLFNGSSYPSMYIQKKAMQLVDRLENCEEFKAKEK